MNDVAGAEPPARAAGPGPAAVEWSFDPWREHPRAAGVASAAVLVFWLAIVWMRFPLVIAVALGAMAAAPLLPAIVPAACRVSAAGAWRRGLIVTAHRTWPQVRRIDDVPVGLLLSPRARRDWLDATRALTLPMPAPRRAELRGLVRGLWGAHGG
ncbi:MAG TPA: hypothetical protein VN896_09580 [Methylomirabilota bacterium]|nr:hypothetical protein [Methylomirabilota bacterium]